LDAPYNKEEELYRTPPPTCNTANVTFSTTIAGIFTTYACNSCHSGPSPSGNVSLASYNSVKTLVNNGRLYGAINHAGRFFSQCHKAAVKCLRAILPE
jgi:hypothetical protein